MTTKIRLIGTLFIRRKKSSEAGSNVWSRGMVYLCKHILLRDLRVGQQ